jgi:hypothetical protein
MGQNYAPTGAMGAPRRPQCQTLALLHSRVQHANAKVHPIPRQPRAQLSLHLLSRSSTIALACTACQCAQSAAIPCAQSALSHVCTIPCALSDTQYHTCVSNTIPCALSALSHSRVQHANAKVHPIPRQPRAQ